MVRSRKKEKTKGLFEAETMKNAVKMALEGATIREAAAHFNLPFQTVGRYLKKIRDNPDIELEMKARCDVRKIFTDDQERELTNFLKDCSKMFYGLTNVETRKLAFEMAEINKIKYPENWKASKMAGKDWLYGFMKRHAELSLRTAEGCSLARAMSFNKYNVDMFFKNYNDVLQRYPELSDPSRIWNLDETKTQTVQRPSRVIAEKGLKQVSKAVSAEKGTLVTTLLFINAAGNTIPPAMVFPRVHFKPHMIIGAPVGTLGLANVSGWMTGPNFVKAIQHFVKYTGCSPTREMLIICDNHESHMCIEAINLAKENGVHILTVPPHSTHMMQPLDVGVMKPFQTFYNSAVDSWMSAHPGQTFSIYNVASCVGVAHSRAMVPQTIINAFKKTGIFPKDSSVYTEDMFIASKVTDRPLPSPVMPQTAVDRPTSATSTPQAGPSLVMSPNLTEPSASAVFQSVTPQTGLLLNVSSRQSEPSEKADRSRQFISPALFRGYPEAQERKKARKPREKGSSKIITSTPEKLLLEERQKQKQEELRLKEEKKKSRMNRNTNKAEKEEGKHISKKRKLNFNEDDTGEVREDIEAENEVSEDEGFTAFPDFSVEQVDLEDFVLVKFVLDKKDVFYAGQVLEKTENGDFVVKFLRKSLKMKNSFFFPNVDDISSVAIKDIVMILPSPSNDKGKTKRQQSFFSFAIPSTKYDIR